MFSVAWATLSAIWPDALLGTGLALSATWVGWHIGHRRSLPPVRAIAWWVTRVVVPLLGCSSWSRRAALIFLNNASVLAIVVSVGPYPFAGLLAAAALGASLGIALRVLADSSFGLRASGSSRDDRNAGRRLRIGLVLNMLEPPAIAVAIGLSIARGSGRLLANEAWETLAVIVIPALFIAAAGEALWLGESNPASRVAANGVEQSAPENV